MSKGHGHAVNNDSANITILTLAAEYCLFKRIEGLTKHMCWYPMKHRYALLVAISIIATCHFNVFAEPKVLRIYHDSDYSNHEQSARSMKMGFLTGLSEIDSQIQGYQIELIEKNHRGNSIRSKLHMQQFIEDSQALFILGGLHSPPYIRFREFINKNSIPLLVPWAAGAPITRYDKGTNWVFRLSIDDAKAGFRISQFAVNELSCQKPHLLLEDTPWGKSNQKNMTAALQKKVKEEPVTSWFNWNTKLNEARILIRKILNQNADCILLVANSIEGEIFAKAMASMESNYRIPIVSHWGITGGDFHQRVTEPIREKLKLYFIQSCFSFVSSETTEFSESVFEKAKKLFPNAINNKSDIPAPPGFIHAYDLSRLVIQSLNNIELTGDIVQDRMALRDALENIQQPTKGLIKTYRRPFTPWKPDNTDAHEALGLNDFCMAQFNEEGHIIVLNNKPLAN